MTIHMLRLLSFAVVFGCLAWAVAPTRIVAAQEAEQAERKDVEREDDRAEFDGEEEDEELEELLEIQGELENQLERLRTRYREISGQMESVETVIESVRQLRALERDLEEAEEAGNERLVEELESKLERAETEFNVREENLHINLEMAEFIELRAEAEDEDDDDRREIIEVLIAGLKTILEINEALIPVYLEGNEEVEAKLEVEKATTFTNKIEKAHRALQVLEHLREADEEDDEELVEALEEKLNVLRGDMLGRNVARKTTEPPVPQIQPIVVNTETLAPYANVDLHKDVAPLLRQHCFECHSNEAESGELNLEKLLTQSPIVKDREKWVNVIEQTKNHVMPPEDAQQPNVDDRKQIVLALHNAVFNFDYSNIDDPGYESARRMTHQEYSNTVRDLFGLEIDVVDRFPDDLTGTSGFENSANSLFIQPLLMERYLGNAEYVINQAFSGNSEFTQTLLRKGSAADPQPIVKSFLLRAFRRPPTDTEVSAAASQIRAAMMAGQPYRQAIQSTFQTTLISPKFLLLTETDHKSEESYRVNDWELASRLSYFLWASMPDDTLFDLASQGVLSEPEVLREQVSRMLADEKADTLGTAFAAQWLGSQHLGKRVRLDPIDNPWCTETLMAAMRAETSMFVCSVIRDNLPIPRLIDADYTFLNEELANLYRIKGVEGEQMRRVLLETKQRGGILGQGSLLAVTSFPGRTSPVVRGKWILADVLGTPPPPPPPNVSELSEEIEENRRLSFREKLELHRQKPNCYACHSQMDPLGFSLEQYDWFGRYRIRRGRSRIDPEGQLPNGTRFKGLAGLKQVIVEQRRDDLVRQVTQKMLSYALGRQLEYYDEPAIRKIIAKVNSDEDRMQTLLQEIVLSYPFQYKRRRPRMVDEGASTNGSSNTDLTVSR